ncbi:MAG: hypothetical protein HY460_02085 [Parcubacteria group bacterium]|nr:hypothetical protein [Parcubacteria group bacterium]
MPECNEWQWCTCKGVLGKEQPLCGCGEHPAPLYFNSIVHWRGKHWRANCAIFAMGNEVKKLLAMIQQVIEGNGERIVHSVLNIFLRGFWITPEFLQRARE